MCFGRNGGPKGSKAAQISLVGGVNPHPTAAPELEVVVARIVARGFHFAA
jgi:hypothetical protein